MRPHLDFAAPFLQIPLTVDTLGLGFGVPVSWPPGTWVFALTLECSAMPGTLNRATASAVNIHRSLCRLRNILTALAVAPFIGIELHLEI